MKKTLFATAAVMALATGAARAELAVKLGVMSDMSSLYAEIGGPGSVEAAKMAVEDFDPAKNGMKVDVISADHLNDPDVGSSIARQWYDVDKVDAIVDVPTSSVALAVSEITKKKNKAFLASGPASSELTGSRCSPNTVHWTYDTWALAHGTGGAIVRQGGDTWFFITADYAFGRTLERDTSDVVRAAGGKVIGSVYVPLNSPDFSWFLQQAQLSNAEIIGLANAGGDTINSIKQAAEFGIVQGGQKLVGLLVFISDVHSLGLQLAQGLTVTTAFYWDLNDKTRAWSQRFAKRNNGRYPTMVQAGVYSETLHYLEAVKQVGSAEDGLKVIDKMKATKWDDPLFGSTELRVDGRAVHAMYLMEVKKPNKSKGPYDYYKVLATIKPEDAFRPLAQEKGVCPLVN
ncbi:MAG TPA: ABC transporter substrate-binding protein [Alphaproteobacteria bacterium]|nr:ABC transporter substrate-binding protein [Alphaproteobacteria bacterium]